MGRVIELSPSSNHRVSAGLREILSELESSESSGSSVVEIVPGHQTARFASERQEKRGLK